MFPANIKSPFWEVVFYTVPLDLEFVQNQSIPFVVTSYPEHSRAGMCGTCDSLHSSAVRLRLAKVLLGRSV